MTRGASQEAPRRLPSELSNEEVAEMDYATLLRDHTTLTCRSIDRIFLQAYVPDLQTAGGAAGFLLRQRSFRFPSSAAYGKLGEK